jgi:hypothetical protein
VKLVKGDFVAFLRNTGVGTVHVMEIAGFFNSGLLATQDGGSTFAFNKEDFDQSVICEHDMSTKQCRVSNKNRKLLQVEWVQPPTPNLSFCAYCFKESTQSDALYSLEKKKTMRVIHVEERHGGKVILEDEEQGAQYHLKNMDMSNEDEVKKLVEEFKHRPWLVAAEEFRHDQRKLWLYCRAYSKLNWARSICDLDKDGFVDLGGCLLGDVEAIALAFALRGNTSVKALVLSKSLHLHFVIHFETLPLLVSFFTSIS